MRNSFQAQALQGNECLQVLRGWLAKTSTIKRSLRHLLCEGEAGGRMVQEPLSTN
jgi:hypothetical protein